MNHQPEFPNYLAQQQPINQLLPSQPGSVKTEQPTSTNEPIITPSLGQIDTVALVQYGGISSAIILSIAILILSLAELIKVLVPVMLHQPEENTK
jgi:hypothetical protein